MKKIVGGVSDVYVSDKTVSAEKTAALVADGIAKPWVNPRNGKTRYYINRYGLSELIGLVVECYKTGNVSGCSYIDFNGEKLNVAHSRAFSAEWSKVFIEDGKVFSTWNPYEDSDIPDLVAMRAESHTGQHGKGGKAEKGTRR